MGGSDSLHAVETVILLLLVLVAGFAAVARRLKVPYPIVLVVAGLVISFFPHMPKVPLEPHIVFVIFLPPLLYAVGTLQVSLNASGWVTAEPYAMSGSANDTVHPIATSVRTAAW